MPEDEDVKTGEEAVVENTGEVEEKINEGEPSDSIGDGDGEVKGGEEDEAGEVKLPEEEQIPWWKNEEVVSPGFKSESEALKSIKEQRSWATRTAQENQNLKLRDEAWTKFKNGDIDESEIDKYVSERETEIAKKAEKAKAENILSEERVMLAIEVGKVRHKDIVIDENLPLLNALAYTSDKETPLERLEDAVVAFKRIAGISDSKKSTVKATQTEMKKIAQTEDAGAKSKKVSQNAWDLSSKEFDEAVQNLAVKQI